MTVLAIDVGNTRIKLGLWHSLHQAQQGTVPSLLTAIPHEDVIKPAPAILEWLHGQPNQVNTPGHVLIAGSHHARLQEICDALASRFDVYHVTNRDSRLLPRNVHHPEQVGIDRLLACMAARLQQSVPSTLIVVDAGTATTVNLCSSDGVFQGGAILPGMRLSARSLHEYTSALPLVDADRFRADAGPPGMPGRSTEEAIRNGLFWGQVGAIRELMNRIALETPEPCCDVFLTGGGGRQLADLIPNAVYVDSLPLIGLASLAGSESSHP